MLAAAPPNRAALPESRMRRKRERTWPSAYGDRAAMTTDQRWGRTHACWSVRPAAYRGQQPFEVLTARAARAQVRRDHAAGPHPARCAPAIHAASPEPPPAADPRRRAPQATRLTQDRAGPR